MDSEPEVNPGPEVPAPRMKRERSRLSSLSIDTVEIGNRIKKFYDDDHQNRSNEIDARLQRHAKYRMWTEGKMWPWEDATDAAIPDMMTASMRMQDTLHNAVMSQRPPIMAKATKKVDAEKAPMVDDLIDYQVFEEQPGEETIGELIDDYVNEGFFTAYVPWVKEYRSVVDIRVLPAIPEGASPVDYFREFLTAEYPQGTLVPVKDGWDWTITPAGEKRKHRASFFTRADGEVEIEIEKDAIRYDGPRIIRKDVQDVLHPTRCGNLQIPGPSNPAGAAHVVLRDFPSVDEIRRLQESGYYDLMDQEDVDAIGCAVQNKEYQQREQQKDTMQGAIDWRDYNKLAESHKQLTRLMVFDCYDIDGDGLDEDVIFWMIYETKTILRARYLTQMFPTAGEPMRPLAEGHLFPIPGRRFSIGILEMMEGLHDLIKQTFDQSGDAGTIANAPFGFYKATSNVRPEVIRLWPGELYPVNDPKNDISFPNLGNASQAFGFNMIGMLNQMEERLTAIGDLQLGRVPTGKSSALRTVTGMQTVLAQGDARPERVLRRFFLGLAQIWKIIHSLNQVFLPKDKQYLISGFKEPDKDPYAKIDDRSKITGSFLFKFSANALNTSKESMQQALQQLMGTYVSTLNIQLGIIEADGIYRMQRDYGRALGQDPDKYIKPPTPGAEQPKIFFEEALSQIMEGQMPAGNPIEGAQAQFEKLTAFLQSDQVGLLGHAHTALFKAYYEKIAKLMMQEQQQQALLAATQQFQQQMQPKALPGPAGAPQPNAQAQTPLQNNELADETLPGAGGGANAMAH